MPSNVQTRSARVALCFDFILPDFSRLASWFNLQDYLSDLARQ